MYGGKFNQCMLTHLRSDLKLENVCFHTLLIAEK